MRLQISLFKKHTQPSHTSVKQINAFHFFSLIAFQTAHPSSVSVKQSCQYLQDVRESKNNCMFSLFFTVNLSHCLTIIQRDKRTDIVLLDKKKTKKKRTHLLTSDTLEKMAGRPRPYCLHSCQAPWRTVGGIQDPSCLLVLWEMMRSS